MKARSAKQAAAIEQFNTALRDLDKLRRAAVAMGVSRELLLQMAKEVLSHD